MRLLGFATPMKPVPVSQRPQCAETLARAPDDAALAIAGLVHDIGHSIASAENYAEGGAALLAGLHVAAKRYPVTTDPAYRALPGSLAVIPAGSMRGCWCCAGWLHELAADRTPRPGARGPGALISATLIREIAAITASEWNAFAILNPASAGC